MKTSRSIVEYMTETWRVATDAYRAKETKLMRADGSQKMREAKPVVDKKAVLDKNTKPEQFGDPTKVTEYK